MQGHIYLTNLIDASTLQRLQDAFSRMTGMAALITDSNGVPITKGSGFSKLCNLVRKTKLGCARCEVCDRQGAKLTMASGQSVTYYCHMGLVDYAAPILVGGKMIGSFIGGQVIPKRPNTETMKEKVRELGGDWEDYKNAVEEIHIIKKSRIDEAAEFLYIIANTLSDIAYHKYQLQEANENLEKSASLKSDFLANMSHEIRTPMNAVIGMAELALREELPPAAREYIQQIKNSGRTLLTIINDILDFSKIESGKMEIHEESYIPFSIINDVANIIEMRIADKNLEFILDIAPDIPYELFGDSVRIKQVIINLANNAVKFTKHGKVILHMYSEKLSDTEMILHACVEDTGIGIKAHDMEYLFQSFQQLDSKRNRNIEGTGLGLAITRRLLLLMNGDIYVESEYGKGSKFMFQIPQKIVKNKDSLAIRKMGRFTCTALIKNSFVKEQLEKDISRLGGVCKDIDSLEEQGKAEFLFIEQEFFDDSIREYAKSHPDVTVVVIVPVQNMKETDIPNVIVVRKPLYSLNLASIINHEKLDFFDSNREENEFDFIAPEAEVLIVDDNPVNLTVAEGLIQPLQMKIDGAFSGKEAINKIAEKRYDLIFMDHMMPEVDGVETTRVIRRMYPEYDDVPIIALTANATSGIRDMFLEEGMNDMVPKPIEIRTILSKLRQWLPQDKIQRFHHKMEEVNIELPEIEGLDIESAVKLLGKESLFMAVLKDYYKMIARKSDLIGELEKKGDWRNYTIEVHALKSSSRQIGAQELSELAAEMEEAGNKEDIKKIREMTEPMLAMYRSLGERLKPWCEDEKEESRVQVFISRTEAELLQQELRTAMDELDIDKMEETMEKFSAFKYTEKQQDILERLREAVDSIDIDSSEALLEEWEKEMR